jgi:hypothetical protein
VDLLLFDWGLDSVCGPCVTGVKRSGAISGLFGSALVLSADVGVASALVGTSTDSDDWAGSLEAVSGPVVVAIFGGLLLLSDLGSCTVVVSGPIAAASDLRF